MLSQYWLMKYILKILLFIFSLTSINTAHLPLYKNIIKNAQKLGAICNDMSPAIYYLHNNRTSLNDWIIYLEGGGGCTSLQECEQRFQRQPYFMSSKSYPDTIYTRTLLSSKLYENFTKVIIPYCSSDSWLGKSMTSVSTNRTIDKLLTKFAFRGTVIFKTVIKQLTKVGLNKANHIVLAGSSAGGIGVFNHLTTLNDMFTSAKISAIIDSAWFINFENYFNVDGSQHFLLSSGISNHKACRDVSQGFPCCLSMSCMLANSYIPESVPLLVLFSQYDVYILFNKDLHQQKNNKEIDILKDKNVLLRVKSFGGRMMQSLDIVQSSSMLSYVFTSCFQHTYITSSTLWETLYQPKTELYFDSVHFEHYTQASNWYDIALSGKSIHSLVTDWQMKVLDGNLNKTTIFDTCAQPQCNPTCPKILYYNSYKSGWSAWKRTALLFIVIFIFASCLLIKLVWIFEHRQLRRTQSLYLCTNYDEEDLDKIMCLPTCPPHSSIGISCSMLQYDIMIPGQPLVGTLKRNQRHAQKTQEKPQRKLSISNMRRRHLLSAPGKQIIKGVTAYFNPGQLVAIMGPSGAGKTTLLDILTSRKQLKQADANIYINGLPSEEVRDWFIKNSGYVLQLATPYHEELTVRQNLTYTAMMRLPMKMRIEDKMWRVEQVLGQGKGMVTGADSEHSVCFTFVGNHTVWSNRIKNVAFQRKKVLCKDVDVKIQCGLFDVANVVVGDNAPNGGGLSGGQKRRLCIALQLLDLPSVIFLDEPTSGLDSASSLELLETLHGLTLSGRLVVVTIHQPRIEIFHMFDSILILCDGQTAYFGSPIVAPIMIAEALQGCGQVFDSSNPADTIMDVLTNRDSQRAIVDHYQNSGEIDAIKNAIERAKRHPQKTLSMKFQKKKVLHKTLTSKIRQTSSVQNRLLALDGRCSASQTFSQRLYFPIVFMLYSLALGTCYWKTNEGVLLMSCYMVFSCASQLFMASVIHAHLNKAFALFSLEKSDGVGHSHELVLHVFIRVFSQSSIPLICACAVIYLCIFDTYVWWKFALTTLIHLQLNQTWIALITCTACLTPRYSPLVSPLLSAIAGFAGGFLVPEPQMPIFYYWLFYINPTHWAYNGMVKVLLSDLSFKCKWNSPLDCQGSEGIMILEQFGLHESNPYASMAVLLFMFFALLILSVVILELKYSKVKWRKFKEEHWQAFKLKFSSLFCCCRMYFEYRKQKKAEEAAERDRLFKLVEHEYRYRSETDASNIGGHRHRSGTNPSLDRHDSKKSYTDAETIDSYNSSNDEDEELPTVSQRDSQKRSALSILVNKIQTSVSSGLSFKGRSNTESTNEEVGTEGINYRTKSKKSKKWKQLLSNRRKTFTGVIEESSECNTPQKRRPRSLLIPKQNEKYSPDIKPAFLNSGKSEHEGLLEHVEYNEEQNGSPEEEQKVINEPVEILNVSNSLNETETTFINETLNPEVEQSERQTQSLPPDIVIDIEGPGNFQPKKNEEENKTEDSVFSSGTETKKVFHTKHKKKKRRNHHKRERKSKDDWSKYLDTRGPRRHEVYCALNSVKKRLRGKERTKDIASVRTKKNSLSLQRQQSMHMLENKRRSLRDQLSGLQCSFNAEDYSPATRKRLQMLRARNRFRKSTQGSESDAILLDEITMKSPRRRSQSRESISSINKNTPSYGISNNLESAGVEERKTRHSKELLERLSSALNSQRNSRNSTAMQSNTDNNDNFGLENISDLEPSVSTELMSVIKKLNTLEGISERGRTRTESTTSEYKHRDSDPLLPQERELIEHLLKKYDNTQTNNSITTSNTSDEHKPLEGQFSFSSKVKIRASPGHSRKTSMDLSSIKPTANFRQSIHQDNFFEEEPQEDFTELKVDMKDSANINDELARRSLDRISKMNEIAYLADSEEDLMNGITKNKQKMNRKFSNSKNSPSSSSGSESDVDEDEEINSSDSESDDDDDNDDDNDDVMDDDKSEKLRRASRSKKSRDGEENSSGSSSDYEEAIVKDHDGFIIPKEAISKVMGTHASPITIGMKLRRESRSQEEEIERQFKRENFLKDRPTRRGIRMPQATTGKVHLLKSKFESGVNRSGNSKRRPSIEKLNLAKKAPPTDTSRTQRTFFRKLRSSKASNSFDEISEDERETMIPASSKT